MIEKRRSTRFPLHLSLSICDLYKQEFSGIHNLDAPIEIEDISEHGLGFTSECILPLNYYFTASFTYGLEMKFTATLKIIRCSVLGEDYYSYGGEFLDLDEDAHHFLREYASFHL